MNINKVVCPVPKDQRPINEYLSLKSSFGFSWTALDNVSYFKVFFRGYFLTLILFVLLFCLGKVLSIKVLFYSVFYSSLIVLLFCLRIYLAWIYIYTRLIQSTVAYEESGWYDGQVWVKTPEILLKDKLAGEYQVKPIISKLKLTLLFLLFTILFTLYFIFF